MRRVVIGVLGLFLVGCGSGVVIPTVDGGQTARWAQGTQAAEATKAPTVAAAGNTAWKTWTDVDGRIRLMYPADWQIGRLSGEDANIAFFTRTDAWGLSVNAFTKSPAGFDADSIMEATSSSHAKDKKYKFTENPIQTVTIGGIAGRTMSATRIPRDNSTTEQSLEVTWAVLRSGTVWNFYAIGDGMWDRSDVDRAVASVTFLA
jgi:hypothetical protein